MNVYVRQVVLVLIMSQSAALLTFLVPLRRSHPSTGSLHRFRDHALFDPNVLLSILQLIHPGVECHVTERVANDEWVVSLEANEWFSVVTTQNCLELSTPDGRILLRGDRGIRESRVAVHPTRNVFLLFHALSPLIDVYQVTDHCEKIHSWEPWKNMLEVAIHNNGTVFIRHYGDQVDEMTVYTFEGQLIRQWSAPVWTTHFLLHPTQDLILFLTALKRGETCLRVYNSLGQPLWSWRTKTRVEHIQIDPVRHLLVLPDFKTGVLDFFSWRGQSVGQVPIHQFPDHSHWDIGPGAIIASPQSRQIHLVYWCNRYHQQKAFIKLEYDDLPQQFLTQARQ